MAVADLTPKNPIRPKQKNSVFGAVCILIFAGHILIFAAYIFVRRIHSPPYTLFYVFFVCNFAFGVDGMLTFVKKSVFGPLYTLF